MDRAYIKSQLITLFARLSTVFSILSVIIFILAIHGLLLNEMGVIGDGLILLTASLFFGSLLGYFIQTIIIFVSRVRGLLKRLWNKYTPPYFRETTQKLPVVQRSFEESRMVLIHLVFWLAVVYLFSVLSSIAIAVYRPNIVNWLASSEVLTIVFLSFIAIIQVPTSILDRAGIVLPLPTTVWDGTILFLLLVLPLPFHILIMKNLDYIITRKYHDISYEIYRKYSQTSEPDISGEITRKSYCVIAFAIVSWVFIGLFVIAALT
jgi:hypothetical protein